MTPKIVVHGNSYNPARVTHKCPQCGREGTLDAVNVNDVSVAVEKVGTKWAGVRKCPNPACNGLVFVIFPPSGGAAVISFPVSHINFDTTDIPENIVLCIRELLDCYANECYVAAAIMVRRTLELICVDKAAQGGDLKARIQDLGKKIVLPQELLTAMDELRLLGNDAAHVQAKAFADIDKPHLDVAIEFAREILKATYQYASLLEKLKALKKLASP